MNRKVGDTRDETTKRGDVFPPADGGPARPSDEAPARRRLSRSGDRKLNRAIHTVVLTTRPRLLAPRPNGDVPRASPTQLRRHLPGSHAPPGAERLCWLALTPSHPSRWPRCGRGARPMTTTYERCGVVGVPARLVMSPAGRSRPQAGDVRPDQQLVAVGWVGAPPRPGGRRLPAGGLAGLGGQELPADAPLAAG